MRYLEIANYHLCAIVDDDVWNVASKHTWSVSKRKDGTPTCVQTMINGSPVSLGQFVMPSTIFVVDHKDHNIFDSRKENLRYATYSQNGANRLKSTKATSSKFKGVSWHIRKLQWIAKIKVNGKAIYLGYFDDEKKAARAYNKAAIKYFGEFAKLNEFGDPLVGSEKGETK